MIFGITGNAGVGKDTVANFLIRDREFCKLSFADPMKNFCKEIFGWTDTQLWGSKDEKERPDPAWDGLTPRKALQLLGTEWGRVCHPDVWVRYAIRRAKDLISNYEVPGVVLPDCRFVNEFNAIKSAGGKMVKLYRPGFEGDGHRSETEQKEIPDEKFDYVIWNVGTLDHLDMKVRNMYLNLKGL